MKVLTSVINVVLLVSFDVAVNLYSFAFCFFVSLPEVTVKRHKVRGGIVSETFSLVYSYEHIGYLLLGNSNAMCNFSGLTNADFTPFFSKYTQIRIPLPSCVISFTSPNSLFRWDALINPRQITGTNP